MRTLDRSHTACLLVLVAFSACLPDPVHGQKVDSLGAEAAGVPPGPLHRSGQPCGACHGPDGPATTRFTLAGTVYQTPDSNAALAGATVRFIDWTGAQFAATTNCVGNFFVRDTDFAPQWPVWMKVEYGTQTAEMISAVFRETSCSTCHADPAGPSTVGHVNLSSTPVAPAQGGCP